MEQGPYHHLRRPSLCPCRRDFPDLSTSALVAPLPEMLPIPHPLRPSSGDTTSGSPQCSPVTLQAGCPPRSSPWPQATRALREEKHKGTQRCCALPSHRWRCPGTPGPRPPSGRQLGVSWPGGRAPILAKGGRLGISGHSSAQWPSRFSKGPLGWTLGPPETQVGAPDPAAQNPMGAPALFWQLPPHSPSALLFPAKSVLGLGLRWLGPSFFLLVQGAWLTQLDRALHRESLEVSHSLGVLLNLAILGPDSFSLCI